MLKSIILGRGFSSTMPAVPEMGPLQRCEKQWIPKCNEFQMNPEVNLDLPACGYWHYMRNIDFPMLLCLEFKASLCKKTSTKKETARSMCCWLLQDTVDRQVGMNKTTYRSNCSWTIEWDLTNGPQRNLLELLDTQVKGSVQWVLLQISCKLVSNVCCPSTYQTLSIYVGSFKFYRRWETYMFSLGEEVCCKSFTKSFIVHSKMKTYIITQLAVYTTYILPIGWLYATYHLLREPGSSIEVLHTILDKNKFPRC